MKIRSKIAIMALSLVLVTTISIMSVIFIQLAKMRDDVEQELITLGIGEAKKVVYNTQLMIEALQSEVEQRLRYDLSAAFALMDHSGPLRVDKQLRNWLATNQYDLSSRQLQLSELVLDGVTLRGGDEGNTTDLFIRNLSDVLGVTCTLFQRMNPAGDMLRVSTTVPTTTGKSAVGTFIPAVHPDGTIDPVIGQVLSGGMFIGRAYVVNDWYNTAYMPLYSTDKSAIIGMLYVGERQSDLVALIKAIEGIAVGENGYVFMLESSELTEERQLINPQQKQGSHCASDSGYACVTKEILDRLVNDGKLSNSDGVQVVRGGMGLLHDNPEMADKIVAYSYFEPWDWVIGVCYNHQNYGSTQNRLNIVMRRSLGWICAAAFLWFSLALFIAYRLAFEISSPLERAVVAFQNVGRGDFEFQLGEASGYELEQLYKSFNHMLQNLRQVTTSRDQLDVEVNARRKVEDQLQQTVATLETIINEAPLSIIILSVDGRVVRWNPAAERIFGWTAEEVVGKMYPLVHGAMVAECADICSLVASGITLRSKEVQRYHKSGRKLDLLLSASGMYENAKFTENMIVILEDISDLKKVQRKLEERKELYKLLSSEFKSILDSIQDVISIIGPDMKIRWSNHGQRRWNLGNEDQPSSPYYAQWNKDKSRCNDCPVIACFESGKIQKSKVTSPDGTQWGIKAFPQCDEQGKVINVIEVASDITESIILREEAMRSARLASLGELAAGIAHEINNPNGVIVHNSPILKEIMNAVIPILDEYGEAHGDFPLGRMPYSRMRERLQKLPDHIIEASQRIKCIVDDLKDFVREEGRGEQQQGADLNLALEAAVRLTANSVKKATHHFHVNYQPDLPLFIGSIQRIEQVIVNLIMNACQALPDTEAAIDISTRFDEKNKTVELSIADQGTGIKSEDLTKVTNPFFTTKRETGGTGLGLSISSRILQEHNGSLHIESFPNKGTTIVITLPCMQEV